MTITHLDNETVGKVDHKINRIGSAMLFADPVVAVGNAVGVEDSLLFYMGGRGGVLGSVGWQQIQSAFGFFPPEIVRTMWSQVREWGDPMTIAGHYAQGMAEATREFLDADTAITITGLGQKVCDTVVPMGYPLFAGWQAMPRPDDAPGAAALTIMTLRELRGDIHVQDIAAAGIRPIEAEVVVRGTDGMFMHGWQPPYPQASDHEEAVSAATQITTARMARIYADSLTGNEWEAFAEAIAHADELRKS